MPDFHGLALQEFGQSLSYAQRMHPDARYYKYHWWVFWRCSTCDGFEFLTAAHALCTADAMDLIERLQALHEKHWIYNRRIPRHDAGVTPFDKASQKWMATAFAPPLDFDPDPVWQGFR